MDMDGINIDMKAYESINISVVDSECALSTVIPKNPLANYWIRVFLGIYIYTHPHFHHHLEEGSVGEGAVISLNVAIENGH